MLFDVYRLRSGGQKLARETLLAGRPSRGLLEVRRRGLVLMATLCDAQWNYVVPCLDRARVVRVKDGRLLIHGMEVLPRLGRPDKARADYCPQAWYCVPIS